MMVNGNVPPMSQSEWDNAPFNKEDNNAVECEVTVSVSMSKDAKIMVRDYTLDDNGYPDFSETDWDSAAVDVCTPAELLNIFRERLENEIANDEEDRQGSDNPKYAERIRYDKYLIQQCSNWIEDENVVTPY